MMKMKVFAAVLLTLCLAAAPVLTEEDQDFSDIACEWYTEEFMMEIDENGRFVMEYNDGDVTGALEQEWRTNEEGDEYAAFIIIPDNPEDFYGESNELVPDIYHPGKMTYFVDENPREQFYDAPIYVMEMGEDEEELETYEPYYTVNTVEDEDEPYVTLMFTFLRPVRDVGVMVMFDQEFDEEGDMGYNADCVEWWETLDSQERIVVTHVFEGDLPDLGISFIGVDDRVLTEVLNENEVEEESAKQIIENVRREFSDEEVCAQDLVDTKALSAYTAQKRERELVKEVESLRTQLSDIKAFPEDTEPLDGDGQEDRNALVELKVSRDLEEEVAVRLIDEQKYVVIPLKEGSDVRVNGKNVAYE